MDQREAAELTAIVLRGITRGMRGEFSVPEDFAEYDPEPSPVYARSHTERREFLYVPDELMAWQQWILWRNQKGNKLPIDPWRSPRYASTTNPRTWAGFSEAAANMSDWHSGLGFVFTADDPFAGVDLDGCVVDGVVVDPVAVQIIEELDSYTEISPSGTGVKIWVRGRIACGRRGDRIEVYSERRYFCVTGQAIHRPGELADCDDLDDLWDAYGG